MKANAFIGENFEEKTTSFFLKENGSLSPHRQVK